MLEPEETLFINATHKLNCLMATTALTNDRLKRKPGPEAQLTPGITFLCDLRGMVVFKSPCCWETLSVGKKWLCCKKCRRYVAPAFLPTQARLRKEILVNDQRLRSFTYRSRQPAQAFEKVIELWAEQCTDTLLAIVEAKAITEKIEEAVVAKSQEFIASLDKATASKKQQASEARALKALKLRQKHEKMFIEQLLATGKQSFTIQELQNFVEIPQG